MRGLQKRFARSLGPQIMPKSIQVSVEGSKDNVHWDGDYVRLALPRNDRELGGQGRGRIEIHITTPNLGKGSDCGGAKFKWSKYASANETIKISIVDDQTTNNYMCKLNDETEIASVE